MVTTVKAWVGAVIAGLTLLGTDIAVENGISHVTSGEWVGVVIAVLATGGGVYVAPRTRGNGTVVQNTSPKE